MHLNWFAVKSCFLRRRYYVAMMMFFGFCNLYALRVNLSIAILRMTRNETVTNEDGSKTADVGEFAQWSSLSKGVILSAFFYGYIVTQLPGGWLASKYGGRFVFGNGILACSFVCFLIPLLTHFGKGWLIFLRILQGLCQGVAYPASHAVWSHWSPPQEKTKLVTIGFSGSYFGTVIALPLSGILAQSYGWRAVFYFFGIFGTLWSVLWLYSVADYPAGDPNIGQDELELIESSTGLSQPQTAHLRAPWLEIVKSPAVWALTIAHTAENYGFYTMLTELPEYIQDLNSSYKLEKASFVSAIPYLIMGLTVQIGGQLADYLRGRRQMATVIVRKLFNCTAFIVQAVFIVIAGYVTNASGALVCVALAVGFGGFAWSGFSVNHLDIAPQFASVLMGLSNTVATIPGMVSPVIAGAIVKHHLPSEWRSVWWLVAIIYLIGAVIYFLFASGERQPWAKMPEGYYEPQKGADEETATQSEPRTRTEELD